MATPVDDWIRDAVIDRLSSPKFAKARRSQVRGADKAQAEAARDLAAAEQRLEELAADYADGACTRREWLVGRERVNECIRVAQRTLDRYVGPLADLPATPKELRAQRDDEMTTMEWRRSVVKKVLASVTIKPSSTRGAVRFDPDRLDPEWIV